MKRLEEYMEEKWRHDHARIEACKQAMKEKQERFETWVKNDYPLVLKRQLTNLEQDFKRCLAGRVPKEYIYHINIADFDQAVKVGEGLLEKLLELGYKAKYVSDTESYRTGLVHKIKIDLSGVVDV